MQQWQEEVSIGIRTLAGGSVQRRVSLAVLMGRVSPETKKQAQGRGIVAGTGPMQWRGLPSIYIKARVSPEEGLGPGQPTCRQVPPEATLSALAAGSGGHGTPGLTPFPEETAELPAGGRGSVARSEGGWKAETL